MSIGCGAEAARRQRYLTRQVAGCIPGHVPIGLSWNRSHHDSIPAVPATTPSRLPLGQAHAVGPFFQQLFGLSWSLTSRQEAFFFPDRRELERGSLHRLPDRTTSQALRANAHRFLYRRASLLNPLQIGLELAPEDSRVQLVPTPPKYLALPRVSTNTHLGSLSTHFTNL